MKTAEAGANTSARQRYHRRECYSPAGTLLQAAQLGLAASVGIAEIEVRRRLQVAVFSTGDELVEPEPPLAARAYLQQQPLPAERPAGGAGMQSRRPGQHRR
jgi:molybdopterin biosynthesis enzyme